MPIVLYQVDAFTNKIFGGNPAAVCPLDVWLPDTIMQSIAAENNLSETVFFVPNDQGFHIRWFTPIAEVDLCGHATLAAAYIIFEELLYQKEQIIFDSHSGTLKVKKTDQGLQMDFPAWDYERIISHPSLEHILGETPSEIYKGKYWMAVFNNEHDVQNLKPNFKDLALLNDIDFLIVTSESAKSGTDFISRFFCPKYGIDEDPVTGSSHCILTPYWSQRLKSDTLIAKQASTRGGDIICESANDRVLLTGECALYLSGQINI